MTAPYDRLVFSSPVTGASPSIVQMAKAKDDGRTIANSKNKSDGILEATSMRKVLNKYPQDAALLAFYLRTDSRLINGLRVGGPISSVERAWSVSINQNFPTPSFKPNGPFRSKQEYEDTLKLIKRGQELEPQNTYFDWMMMLALLHGGRQEEAIQVVEKAWKKTDFNDHTCDEVSARAEYSLPSHQHYEPGAKIAEFSSTLLPHFSPIREMTRYLAQHTMSLRLQKRDVEALEWGRKCLAFIRPIRQRGNFLITSLVGRECEIIILRHAAIAHKTITFSENRRQFSYVGVNGPPKFMTLTENPYSLSHLAKQTNSSERLKELESEWALLQKWRIKTDYSLDGVITTDDY